MTGHFGQGAQAAGADVEQMAEVGGGVGDAPAELAPRLDDHHAHPGGCSLLQVDGGQGTRCPAADYTDNHSPCSHVLEYRHIKPIDLMGNTLNRLSFQGKQRAVRAKVRLNR